MQHKTKQALTERGLDGVNALVGEAGDLDVSADLHGLRGQTALDVRQQVRLQCLRQVQAGEDVRRLLALVAVRVDAE